MADAVLTWVFGVNLLLLYAIGGFIARELRKYNDMLIPHARGDVTVHMGSCCHSKTSG